jgi:hypothetical protein
LRKLVLMFAMVLLFCCPFGNPTSVWADCKSDCRDQYKSDVQSCNLLNDDPEDSNILQLCMDNAINQRDSCIAECEDEYGNSQTSHR